MGKMSKFFRAFVEGQTISDGREVTAVMIDNIVDTFNVETYAPRVNVEHVSGYSPEPPFNGYGTVAAVKSQVDDIVIAGKTEKRKALYIQVDANDQLVTLAERDQKPFPSVELTPSYAGTDKEGLIGLAFTDTPASIATQRLQFSRVNGNLVFTSTERAALAFDAAPADPVSLGDAIATGLAKALGPLFKRGEPEKAKEEPKPEAANDNFDVAAFSTAIGGRIAAAVQPIADAQAALSTELAGLKTQLAGTEQPRFSRQPSTGGGDDYVTDC